MVACFTGCGCHPAFISRRGPQVDRGCYIWLHICDLSIIPARNPVQNLAHYASFKWPTALPRSMPPYEHCSDRLMATVWWMDVKEEEDGAPSLSLSLHLAVTFPCKSTVASSYLLTLLTRLNNWRTRLRRWILLTVPFRHENSPGWLFFWVPCTWHGIVRWILPVARHRRLIPSAFSTCDARWSLSLNISIFLRLRTSETPPHPIDHRYRWTDL